jgi:outer membrane protein assembly factor BamB
VGSDTWPDNAVTLDARVVALDMKTGQEIWSVKSGEPKDGIAMTGAPLIANGVLSPGWPVRNTAAEATLKLTIQLVRNTLPS